MKRLNVVQGSPDWKALRAKYPCASEAPIIMGASRHMSRGELLRLKAAGMEKEFSGFVQRMVLDKGHAVEVPAREITEAQIGEKLYPITAVDDADEYLASLDGVTMAEDWLMEHKQWNEELAAAIRAGATEFPDGQQWQMEQQLLVAQDAEGVIFVCSDGTQQRRVQVEYRRVPGRAEQLRAGWKQFHADLAAGVAPPAAPKAVAEALDGLPAVSLRMDGALQVVSNLDTLEPLLRAFIERIPAKPSTDQEFATTDAACKALKKLEEELDRTEASALSSLEAVGAMQRLKATLHKLARDTRLQREKLVDARKLEIRTEEINRGRKSLDEVIAGHNAAIGRPYMPPIAADFTGCVRGLRTVQSVRDAVDQELARAKIAAGETFQRIHVNMTALRDLAADYRFLFNDAAALVLKATDDCRAVITARIADHQREEAERLENERKRIRAEEEERAATAQRQKNAMAMSEIQGIQQQVMIATLGRAGVRKGGTIECIRETLAETEAWPIAEENFGALTGSAQAVKDKAVADIRQLLAEAEARAIAAAAPSPAATTPIAHEPATAVATKIGSAPLSSAPNVVPIQRPAVALAAPKAPATISITALNEGLGLNVTSGLLEKVGFTAATVQGKAGKFYSPDDLPGICGALSTYLLERAQFFRQERAA